MYTRSWLQTTLPIKYGCLGIRRVVSLASSAYLASAASTLGLVQSAIGQHSIVKTPLYGFDEVLLEALRDSLPRMISLEATEQSLSHRPLVELDKTEVRRSMTDLAFRAIFDATCSPHSANCYRVSALQIVVGGLTLYT